VLDTFPYSGYTTRLDARWMGVTLVTLVGPAVVGRAGLSPLTNLGLSETAAATPAKFLTSDVELAGEHQRLGDFRAPLRERVPNSPLLDAPWFARGIDAA
jgi:predicted O-linked N-acetylglucosamine transferase (SPINDLY family)